MLLKNFARCGLTGWCLEILFTSADSLKKNDKRLIGQTSLWMFPIYGIGALIQPVYPLLKRLPAIYRSIIYCFSIFSLEYITGSILKKFQLCPWDYSQSPFHIKGLIRLDYAPYWMLVGLLFEYQLTGQNKKQT